MTEDTKFGTAGGTSLEGQLVNSQPSEIAIYLCTDIYIFS